MGPAAPSGAVLSPSVPFLSAPFVVLHRALPAREPNSR